MTKYRRVAACLAAMLVAGGLSGAATELATGASAASGQARVNAYVDDQMRPLFGDVAAPVNWLAGEDHTIAAQVCAGSPEMRIAVMRRALNASERRQCEANGRRALFQKRIGSVIVLPVAAPGAFAGISTRQLFEAVAAQDAAGQPNRRQNWRQVDPSLPDAPLKLLLPAAGSPEDAALTIALMRSCLAHRQSPLAVSAAERIANCAKLRTDAAVARAGVSQTASQWLAATGAGAMALVGYGQLAADTALSGVTPLDGALPVPALRARGDYPASLPVYLVISHSGRNQLGGGDGASALADALLAEGAVGPAGQAARAGLAPLPSADRVALRKDLSRFLARGGQWE